MNEKTKLLALLDDLETTIEELREDIELGEFDRAASAADDLKTGFGKSVPGMRIPG